MNGPIMVTYYTDPCMVCGRISRLSLDRDALRRWQQGELIQNAFPNLTASERELVITGTHSQCWDAAFALGEM